MSEFKTFYMENLANFKFYNFVEEVEAKSAFYRGDQAGWTETILQKALFMLYMLELSPSRIHSLLMLPSLVAIMLHSLWSFPWKLTPSSTWTLLLFSESSSLPMWYLRAWEEENVCKKLLKAIKLFGVMEILEPMVLMMYYAQAMTLKRAWAKD